MKLVPIRVFLLSVTVSCIHGQTTQWIQQQFPFARGNNLVRDIPNISFNECSQMCESVSCSAFTFKYADPSTLPEGQSRCWLYAGYVEWGTDPVCGMNSRFCIGYSRSVSLDTPYDFDSISPPFISDAPLSGYPKYGIDFASCTKECRENPYCVSMTYKNPDMTGSQSMCLLSKGWNPWFPNPSICGPNDSLCKGLRKRIFTTSTDGKGCPSTVPGFVTPAYPVAQAGSLRGYPVYLESCLECVQRCILAGPDCASITFKNKNPQDPNDYSACFLMSQASLWGGHSMCGPDTIEYCRGYARL